MQNSKTKKTIPLQRIRKDFLWRSVEYSSSFYECRLVLKLTQFLEGGSKWFKACIGAHDLEKKHTIRRFAPPVYLIHVTTGAL